MSFSLARMMVFFMIGLPIGFILSGLGLASLGQPITAPSMAPWGLGIAALVGIIAGFWKPAA